jgi:alpha-N-arabinofuranosidase
MSFLKSPVNVVLVLVSAVVSTMLFPYVADVHTQLSQAVITQDVSPTPSSPASVDILADTSQASAPANALLAGNNIQWINNGDQVLVPGTLDFNPTILDKIKTLRPTSIRYPGGTLADTYHWQQGVGALETRPLVTSPQGQSKILFGTKEFLEVVEATGAQPLITVNVVTGTPEEAAGWVRYINSTRVRSRTGAWLPKVKYWEIGNEPYLKSDNPDLAITPEEFAKRANLFIKAMRKVDPTIEVGIPLRSDVIGGLPANAYPGYNVTVLKNITAPYQFISLHDAYMPAAVGPQTYPDRELYLASMTASAEVRKDIEATRQLLRTYKPTWKIKIALTEYNAMYTANGSASDAYIASLASALYSVDLAVLFSGMDDVFLAQYWSLSDDWYFGAIGADGHARPSFYALQGLRELLRGSRIPLSISAPMISSTPVGYVPAQTVSAVSGLATLEGNMLRMFIVNKDPDQQLPVSVRVPSGRTIATATYTQLTGDGLFAGDPGGSISLTDGSLIPTGSSLAGALSPHSAIFLTISLTPLP